MTAAQVTRAHRTRPMRLILLLLACGAAGAAVNVAVAWGLAIGLRDVQVVRMAQFDRDGWIWHAAEGRTVGIAEVRWFGHQLAPHHVVLSDSIGMAQSMETTRAFLVGRSYTEVSPEIEVVGESGCPDWCNRWFDAHEQESGRALSDSRASGWPFLALWYQLKPTLRLAPAPAPVQTSGGIVIDRTRWLGVNGDPIVLALRPLWPGFAINTMFYAGVLWMLFCGPFALRRMIRRRRGQCAQCGYPIGQNERCTECGAAVGKSQSA